MFINMSSLQKNSHFDKITVDCLRILNTNCFDIVKKKQGTILFYNQQRKIDYKSPPTNKKLNLLTIKNQNIEWTEKDEICKKCE